MNPFDLPQAEGKKQLYTRDRNERGQYSGSLLMGNSIPAEIAEGHKEDISKRSLLPRMIKPAGIPKPPKPPTPGGAPKLPKPAAVPSTRVASAGQARIKQTGLGVRKALYASVPTTKKEQRRERVRNATSAGLFSGGATAGLTAAMGGGRKGALRAAGQGAMIMTPIGAALGASQKPHQRKMVRVSKRGERGDLKAYQFANHEHIRTSRRRGDKVLARESIKRRVSKMSPDPSAVHVMGMGKAPRSRAQAQAAAQKAARTRRFRPLA